jgi:chromosome segregation ATPase
LQFEQKLAIAQDRISQLENNNKELQLSLDKIRIEKNFAENESREYKEKITRLLTLVSTHTKENESIRQQYDESQTKVRELQQKLGHITVLEQQKHELEDKIKKLETEVTQNKNKDTELKKITLELDIAYAENEGLKDRARRFETVHQDLVRITSDLDKANYSLREWNLAFPLKQAHDIATSLKKLEMENKSMIELNNTLRDELTKLQKVHASVTQTSHEANALSEKLKTQLDEERKLSEVLRKETMILRTELESRKRMIESFEKQLAVETGNATNDTIRELENALRERNSQIESLTRDYSQLTASLGRKDSEIESKENVIARLTKDVTVLESEKQQLQNAMVRQNLIYNSRIGSAQ